MRISWLYLAMRSLRLAEPVCATAYPASHALGALLLIDPQSGRTIGAAMVQDDGAATPGVLGDLRAETDEWVS